MKKPSNTHLSRDEAAQKRRELILEAAIECFVVKGFHQTSIRDIANKARISLGNVYNHFESKDALIAEISALEAIELKEFEGVLTNSNEPLLAIEQFVDEYLKHIEHKTNAIMTVEITAEAIRNPRISKGFVANRREMAKKVLAVLSSGVKLGQFDPNINNTETAELLIDLVEGLALRSAFAGKKASKTSRASLRYMVRKCICA